MTWPAPRRLMSMKLATGLRAASPVQPEAVSDMMAPLCPEKPVRHARPRHLAPYGRPDLTNGRHDRRGVMTKHLEDQACFIRQAAGAPRQSCIGIKAWRDRFENRIEM